jgi:membrane-associated protease RseP (regulator of RpoE activity)
MSANKSPAKAWDELGFNPERPPERVSERDPARPSDPPPEGAIRYRTSSILFVLTVLSVFFAGAEWVGSRYLLNPRPTSALEAISAVIRLMPHGWIFAVPLMVILLAHEFGHFIAARIHRVPASLPYFLPLPLLSIFGTLGAVILMPARIRSRNALLDIGAAGPLAGMVIALPVMAIGLEHSELIRLTGAGMQEGQSLLYLLMKRMFVGEIPAGYDVNLHPTAIAGWAGFLITMINLLPVGQLDGGHIAYALFDERQNRFARWIGFGMLALFAYNLGFFLLKAVGPKATLGVGDALGNSSFWVVWFLFTRVLLLRLSGGVNHPPTEPGELSPGRKAIAWLSLILFVLLFMPTPFAVY